MVELAHAADLRFDVGGCPAPDMAGHAVHTRVGGMLGGHKLGVHRKVTRLSAELHGFGVLVGLVAANCCHEQKHHTCKNKDPEDLAVARTRKVDGESHRLRIVMRPALLAEVQVVPQQNKHDARNEKNRGDHIGENAHVRIPSQREDFEREEQEERKKTSYGNDRTRKADPVTNQAAQ